MPAIFICVICGIARVIRVLNQNPKNPDEKYHRDFNWLFFTILMQLSASCDRLKSSEVHFTVEKKILKNRKKYSNEENLRYCIVCVFYSL